MNELLTTVWKETVACIFAVVGGVVVFKITQARSKKEDLILRNVLKASKREKVTVDWISDRVGWSEAKVLEVAAAYPNRFRTGVVQPSDRSFVALK